MIRRKIGHLLVASTFVFAFGVAGVGVLAADVATANQVGEPAQNGELGQIGQGGEQGAAANGQNGDQGEKQNGQNGDQGEKQSGQGGEGDDAAPAAPKK
jgi:hypothetical protein